jgi:hypothetical protein
MRPPIEFLFPPELGAEMLYSFVIIVCSLMIYYSTKEMYELSAYKGIKYFRQAFLFFSIAYFFRYFILFFLAFFNIENFFGLSRGGIFSLSMAIFLYSSSMAVFSLLYSVMWRKFNHNRLTLYVFNILAIIIAFIGITFRGMEVSLLLNIFFFIFAAFILFVAYKESKPKQKGRGLFVIYLLLFIFFFLNIINLLIPQFLQFYKLGVYLASTLLFMSILYKVLKKIGN